MLLEDADHGGGLSPGRAGLMFRPFSQLGGDRTGLGLSLSTQSKASMQTAASVPGRVRGCGGLGWLTGLEPATTGITILDSTN